MNTKLAALLLASAMCMLPASAQISGNWPLTTGSQGAIGLHGTADQVFATDHTADGAEAKTVAGAGGTSVAGGVGTLTITSPVIKTGTATLASGTATVADTSVDASSVVTVTSTSGTGETYKAVVTSGTGFVITSSNGSSTATVGYIRAN